jgi:hypothetical protein
MDAPTKPVIVDSKTALYVRRGLQGDKIVNVNGKAYTFKPRGGVGLAWVDNADVGAVLEIRAVCCGGQRTPVFDYANSNQANYWLQLNGGSYE